MSHRPPTLASSLAWALLLGVLGPCFGMLAGLVVLGVRAGVRTLRRRAAERRFALEGPADPDTDWRGRRDGAGTSAWLRPIPTWTSALVIGGVGLPLNLSLPVVGTTGVGPLVYVLTLGAAACVFGTVAAWIVLRGGVAVRFASFPYVVGERAAFFVATTPGAPRLTGATFLLRCVDPTGTWSSGACTSPHGEPGPDEFVEVTIDVRPGLPGTAARSGAVRWELVVTGRNRWGRVAEAFPVPVYERPSAPSA